MKAKLKNGEVIKIADYDFVELEHCDSYGDPIQVKWDEIEAILDDDGCPLGLPKKVAGAIIMPNIDWESRRYEIAKEMLPITSEWENSYGGMLTRDDAVIEAIKYADALIEELKK